VLAATGVSKKYEHHQALSDVSLTAEAGEIVALLGPNGAGKTTLLSIIAGLRTSDTGTVSIGGFDLSQQRAQAISHVAVAPQDTGVQLQLTGRQNLEFYGRLAGLDRRAVNQEIDTVSAGLELGAFLDRKTSELSGGQRRRIHAGCALVARPKLLLLDEPTVGADLEMRAQLLGVVRELADSGTTVLYTTHYLPEVEALDARVVLLEHGRVLLDAPLDQLLNDHASSFVELTFDGPAPEVELAGLRVLCTGHLLRAEGAGVASRTALDTAYLALTGQRFSADSL